MLIYYDHTVHMSHWEGFGTLLMATDTSNALLDPVLYGTTTVCSKRVTKDNVVTRVVTTRVVLQCTQSRKILQPFLVKWSLHQNHK